MDSFIDELTVAGFTRTSLPFSKPLVVHAVAGAGKSTVLRNFCKLEPTAVAYTHGKPDPPNLEQTHIRVVQNPVKGHFCLLDEYTAQGVSNIEGWSALLADPLQHDSPALRPHFVKHLSHRVCPKTATLLQGLGIQIQSARQDEAQIDFTGLFDGPIIGTVIHLDQTAKKLASSHGIQSYCPRELRSFETEVVTVISTSPITELNDKVGLYIACTRHTKALHVRAPPPYPSS